MELLRELVPRAETFAVLLDRRMPTYETLRADTDAAARSLGQKIHILNATTEREIENAFNTLVQMKSGGLLVGTNPFFSTQRSQIMALAMRHGVPAIYDSRVQVEAGGLISYGTSYTDTYRQAGVYAGRILKGARLTSCRYSSYEIRTCHQPHDSKGFGLDDTANAFSARRRGDRMRRREFIAGFCGGAAAWPVVARAQQREPMRRVGWLTSLAADDPQSLAPVTTFVQELQKLGWTVGRNLRVDYRFGAIDPERKRTYVAELSALGPDVMLAPPTVLLRNRTLRSQIGVRVRS